MKRPVSVPPGDPVAGKPPANPFIGGPNFPCLHGLSCGFACFLSAIRPVLSYIATDGPKPRAALRVNRTTILLTSPAAGWLPLPGFVMVFNIRWWFFPSNCWIFPSVIISVGHGKWFLRDSVELDFPDSTTNHRVGSPHHESPGNRAAGQVNIKSILCLTRRAGGL